jgi:hypothetical protein
MAINDIENMIIWERDIYITMLNSKLEKEKLQKEENAAMQFKTGMYR